MPRKKIFFILLSITASLAAIELPSEFPFDQSFPENLEINNRILLKINGKVITVLDVTRKMDLLFYKQYPELVSSAVARYQFYVSAWRTILSAVIDDALIMADAEEKKITVSDGEVREELESLFGPDVVLNLDKLGMTIDEAFELLKKELTVQRTIGVMVRNKALTDVHPAVVKKRYEKVRAENPAQNMICYQILSLRGPNHEIAAQRAYQLLTEENIPFEEVAAHLSSESLELAYSDEFRQKESDLSQSYKSALEKLEIGQSSLPLSTQKVSRLFCLRKIEKIDPPLFKDLEEGIKRELVQEAMIRYNSEYRQKLRKNYGLTEAYLSQLIPDDLRPFVLR